MKKFLGFIVAVGMIAAGIAPAMAADVELSGEVRVRHEITNLSDTSGDKKISAADDLSSTATGGNTTYQRTRVNFKAQVDDQTTVFISLADVRQWGEDGEEAKANGGDDEIGLNEGWLQLDNVLGPVGIKAGRQRLSFGKQRLLGALEWTDTGNRWDALSFLYGNDVVDAQLFFAELDDSDGIVNTDNTDYSLNGLYITVKDVVPTSNVDVYAIQKTGEDEMDFLTYGLRVAGKAAGFDWDAEWATQSGEESIVAGVTTDQEADAWAINVGYSMPDVMGLRIGAQAWSADGAEGTDAAFDNLYPTNHFKYGIADVAGSNWSDREGFGFDISLKPMDNLSVKAEYVTIEQESGAGNDVGDEINVQIKYGLTEKVKLYVYAVQFDFDEEYYANAEEFEKVGIQLHAKF